MKLRTLSLSAALVVLAAAPVVHADTMISGHGGWAFSGDLEDSRTTWGGALTFMGDGPFGFEIEGAYTPDFFADSDLIGSNNVSSLMGNILLGASLGQSKQGRIYVSFGGGLMKTSVDNLDDFFDVDSTDWGVSAGGGAMGFFSNNVGVRGDIRYFRNFGDTRIEDFDFELGDFTFWRGTGGIVLRF